jgi:hypothetical protein
MDLEIFRAEVRRVRAEQFFTEKTASAPGVSAVAVAGLARASEAEDPELLKVAAKYCPEAPLEFYEKRLFGKFKTAEPGPPKGVSVKDWDKILQRGPAKSDSAE